jgi:carbonic anhydrase
MKRKIWLMLVALVAAAQWKTHWSYEGVSGPEHWGDLDPDYAACKAGKEQSPIDIRNAEKAELPALRRHSLNQQAKHLRNDGRATIWLLQLTHSCAHEYLY